MWHLCHLIHLVQKNSVPMISRKLESGNVAPGAPEKSYIGDVGEGSRVQDRSGAHAKATCAFVASLSLDCSAICCPLSPDCIATAMALMPMMAWWGQSGNSVQALA